MKISAIYIIWLREMKKYVRNRSRLIGNMAMPFFFLAFLGMGFNSLGITGLPEGISYIDFLAPGIVAMGLLFSSMFAGVSILWDRQFGFLKEIMVAPVDRTSIVIGRIFAGMTSGVIQAIFILCISLLMGVRIVNPLGLVASLAFIMLIAMSFVGLGISIASKIEDMHGFQLIMNFLIMPTFLLSGALFPLDRLPAWLAAISYLDPLTYGVDGLRSLIIGTSHFPVIVDLAVLGGFCLAMILMARHLFNKTEV
ncbi:MAG: ABC transporter permease [Candidatus Aenigmarchaeota archaeon]|nr:ABC transporter permease [Candidatus Aenigmarchaeota archaeon]